MKIKLFGDTTPINWQSLGVKMPFAPIHELAKKYQLEPNPDIYNQIWSYTLDDLNRTFGTKFPSEHPVFAYRLDLLDRITYRANNTINALDQATSNTICVNLGGGYHHAGKYPDSGYAYSLINDIIWAVDYQLEQNKTIGIIDLDFHFGGGTWEYYQASSKVVIHDHHQKQGILYKHKTKYDAYSRVGIDPVQKIILNIGTDRCSTDQLFGKFNKMSEKQLLQWWQETITKITLRYIPLAITMGGGYGSEGLKIYEELISWLQEL